MSKKLGFNKFRRNRRTVHLDKGLARACRELVNLVGYDLFTAAVGPGDQDTGIGRSHFFDHFTHLLKGRGFADHVELFVDLFAQALVFGHQLFAVQSLANGGDQAVEVGGLGDVVVGSAANAAHGRVQVAVAADHHKRRIGIQLHRVGQHLKPVALGHLDVAEHEVVARRIQCGDGLVSVLGLVDGVLGVLVQEDVSQYVANCFFVFYQKYARHGVLGS